MPDTLLSKYQPYPWQVEKVDLHFLFSKSVVRVTNLLTLKKIKKTSHIFLNGVSLELIGLAINQQEVTLAEIKQHHGPVSEALLARQPYIQTDNGLYIATRHKKLTITVTTKIYPDKNLSLKGLYRSGDVFCTQCEAEGFRRVTYYPDRPDVLSVFTTTITALEQSYPVLLSNGECVKQKSTLIDNERFSTVVWHDPHPKPCYLFAIVAGKLSCHKTSYQTTKGKRVAIHLYTEDRYATMTTFAIRALKQAMRWDEERYGCFYDLSLFQIVAVDHFNAGAMENKGLNIFNANTVIADAATASDADIMRIKTVVAHEYFHNWTGNRITCRDWFQLSLKEGLTVFRENQFSEEVEPLGTERISQAEFIRSYQFSEDASQMAHPVRPHRYSEIDNLYTSTVYDKGAEIVRMIWRHIGDAAFVRGMRHYFKTYDGKAVRVEELLSSLSKGVKYSLKLFLRWYEIAGTPQLSIKSSYDIKKKTYRLTFTQHPPKIFDSPLDKYGTYRPLPIPITATLIAKGKVKKTISTLLTTKSKSVVIKNIPALEYTPAFFPSFSAPVIFNYDYQPQQFQQLALAGDACIQRVAISELYQFALADGDHKELLYETMDELLEQALQSNKNWGLIATLLTPTDPITLISRHASKFINPISLFEQRKKSLNDIAQLLESKFVSLYEKAQGVRGGQYSVASIARRSMRALCLSFIARSNSDVAANLAQNQYHNPTAMSDSLSALMILNQVNKPKIRANCFVHFENSYGNNALLMQKWLRLQTANDAFSPKKDFAILRSHSSFDSKNPNCLYSLYAGFHYANFKAFHQPTGYQAIYQKALTFDKQNPQVAAAILKQNLIFHKLDPVVQKTIQSTIKKAMQGKTLSPNSNEVLKSLYGITSI